MSESIKTFERALSDAEALLKCYDDLNENKDKSSPPPEALKRASLIMILTAWETYVEDIAMELFEKKFSSIRGCQIGTFMEQQFSNKLKSFHNPDSQKTKQLFLEFFGADVASCWVFNNYPTSKEVSTQLNLWISKRGDAVHRAHTDKQATHIVKRTDLDKCLFFFRTLVKATDNYLAQI